MLSRRKFFTLAAPAIITPGVLMKISVLQKTNFECYPAVYVQETDTCDIGLANLANEKNEVWRLLRLVENSIASALSNSLFNPPFEVVGKCIVTIHPEFVEAINNKTINFVGYDHVRGIIHVKSDHLPEPVFLDYGQKSDHLEFEECPSA